MNNLKLLLLASCIWLTPLYLHSKPIPEQLLDMPIPLMSGKNTVLSEFKENKPVYLKFWATWCQPCMKEMPHFQHVQEQYGKDIEVIGINLGMNDDREAVNRVIAKFGLTMPMSIDKSGDLAQAFRMIDTPYHLVFDRNMNLVHRGHEASESLDNKLSLLAQSKTVDFVDREVLSETEANIKIDTSDGKLHALFFTATWCDWYLQDTRPEVSKNCINAQKAMNTLALEYPTISWHGIISRLWTADKDLSEYQKKYLIKHPIEIDKSNQLFHQFGVTTLPTLILIKNGKVQEEIKDFSKLEKVKDALKR
ncbi:redoxin domain-containing protein [Pleionea litopenaei]|uniref:Redoxin domain-containing protein n=1 Tax=Pleionea litopenaei TaxID=3070815 RepID=A0AA51RWK7_9GAMM|nr:redoxin domain-containing protein [Pleionea sp. HL-JVS1]WMS88917.1 redoxin domain-containing protein [Pleionea sp. HL-JVS1]